MSQELRGCEHFRDLEDQLFQTLGIMGLALKASLRLEKDLRIRKFLSHGTEAAVNAERIMKEIRSRYEKDCHCKFD